MHRRMWDAPEDDGDLPMAAEAVEVLNEWRRAERLLTALPDDAPERSEVEVHVEQLRSLYQRVTGATIPSSAIRLESTRRQISRSRDYLDRLWSRYDADVAAEPTDGL